MRKTIFILLILIQSIDIFACCAEKDYRLFPLGEINNEVIFIEFNLFRNCNKGEGGGLENEFWLKGTINLMKGNEDSLFFVENIDSIRFKECVCTYKNFYEKTKNEIFLKKYYLEAIKKLKQEKSFQIITSKEITFNDTLNTHITENSTDTSFLYLLEYKELLKLDLGKFDIISCYPDKVTEERVYVSRNYEITILRLRCSLKSEEEIRNIKNQFENIETAIWKEPAQWHGIAKDFYIIKKKKR